MAFLEFSEFLISNLQFFQNGRNLENGWSTSVREASAVVLPRRQRRQLVIGQLVDPETDQPGHPNRAIDNSATTTVQRRTLKTRRSKD
jgi:hypothetical protein